MGWLDDARKKAEETAEEAKAKAQQKAAEATVAAAGAAVKKSVGGFFEGLVSSAEASLADAEERARARGLKLDGPEVGTDTSELEAEIRAPEEDPLGDAVRRAESHAWREPEPVAERVEAAEPVEAAESPVQEAIGSVQAPVAADPFADAYAAIARAREARGVGPEEPPPARVESLDPVEAALAAAREARAYASSGGTKAREREDAARAELAALKAARGGVKPSDDDDEAPAPRKRNL